MHKTHAQVVATANGARGELMEMESPAVISGAFDTELPSSSVPSANAGVELSTVTVESEHPYK